MNAHLFTLGRLLLMVAAIGLHAVAPAHAQGTPADCDLRIAGGPAGKVYELMIRDMLAVCGGTVRVCPVTSTGGLQNLSLIAANEAELGIVQLDTLREMKEGGDDALQSLQAVMPLHGNLLHVLTRAEGSVVDVWHVPLTDWKVPFTGSTTRFTTLSELKGRTVVAVGSARLTSGPVEETFAWTWRRQAWVQRSDSLVFQSSGHKAKVTLIIRYLNTQSLNSFPVCSGFGARELDHGDHSPKSRFLSGLDSILRFVSPDINVLIGS